jgi:hypothetical protein
MMFPAIFTWREEITEERRRRTKSDPSGIKDISSGLSEGLASLRSVQAKSAVPESNGSLILALLTGMNSFLLFSINLLPPYR